MFHGHKIKALVVYEMSRAYFTHCHLAAVIPPAGSACIYSTIPVHLFTSKKIVYNVQESVNNLNKLISLKSIYVTSHNKNNIL